MIIFFQGVPWKMRVRVTNFTSLTTVDYPLVLISGCVDNYSDQVHTLDFCWFLSETGPIIGIQSVVGVCWNFFLFICKCWRWWNWILKLLYWVKSLNWVSSTHCLSLSCNVLPPISEVPRPDDFYQTRSIVLCCKQVSGNQQVMNFTHRYKVVDYFLRREQNMDT